MGDCNHEETDTRIVIHVNHAIMQGAKIIEIRTVDTDVIVILVGIFHELTLQYPSVDIWVAFGMGISTV